MKEIHNSRKTVYRATLLGLLITLAACGGGDEEVPCNPTNDWFKALVCGLVDATGKPAATEAPTAEYDTNTSSQLVATVGDHIESAEMIYYNEFEPNSSLDNANVVTLPSGPIDTSVGLEIDGSVQSADDSADYFIFTPNRSGVFSAYLCAVTCAEILQDDAVYIMIYDQNQTTIASTSIGSIVAQELAADLSSGLAYYVQVQGYNTGEGSYDYRLVIID